jgi:hypothetical protein
MLVIMEIKNRVSHRDNPSGLTGNWTGSSSGRVSGFDIVLVQVDAKFTSPAGAGQAFDHGKPRL